MFPLYNIFGFGGYDMFRSTRQNRPASGERAIVEGMDGDGGLFVPKVLPALSLDELYSLDYRGLSSRILGAYFPGFAEEKIKRIVSEAYDGRFAVPEVVNLREAGGVYFLELFHGPTLAFKDIALSVLPSLYMESKKKMGSDKGTLFLTATSGDTGSAALAAFSGMPEVASVVLYPENGVGSIQECQMLRYSEGRSLAVAYDGDFDAIQGFVKRVMTDKDILGRDIDLASANSINIGRLIPQVAYYFYAYARLVSDGAIKAGEKINFVVPTGNFGNVFAGYFARRMGLPVGRLICALNRNRSLGKLFKTGRFRRRKRLIKTITPAMDILVPSNLERLLYYAAGEESEAVLELTRSLRTRGAFRIPGPALAGMNGFASYWASEKDTLSAINYVYSRHGYLIDPHTAVGYHAYLQYKSRARDKTKTVILATAHPFKFPATVLKALGKDCDDEFLGLEVLSGITGIETSASLTGLEKYRARKSVWTADSAESKLKARLKACGLR
jgi:threonine synthase